jgi:hypothetical protein
MLLPAGVDDYGVCQQLAATRPPLVAVVQPSTLCGCTLHLQCSCLQWSGLQDCARPASATALFQMQGHIQQLPGMHWCRGHIG